MADSDPVEYADVTVLEVVNQVDPVTRRPTALNQGHPRGPGLVSKNVTTCRNPRVSGCLAGVCWFGSWPLVWPGWGCAI
jgi:hypothetical protein